MFRNVQFLGKAGWFEHSIPATHLELYDNWSSAVDKWQQHRQNGVF